MISGVASLTRATSGDLSFLGNPRYRSDVANSQAYIATNFLGHGTVNPKANESDD